MDPKNCRIVEPSTLPRGSCSEKSQIRERKVVSCELTASIGLGVPGLSVLSDLESPTLSEKELDLFLAALIGTFSELLRDSKEDILSFNTANW